ncbi:hypothetical protein CRYUN_Cryun17cG0056900 [Craigia yunnanensis]
MLDMQSLNYNDNREPGKSSDQFPKLELQSCFQNSEPSDFFENVKPVVPSKVPSLDFQKSRPSNLTTSKIELATSSSQDSLLGLKNPEPTKIYDDEKPNTMEKNKGRCNIFEGKWVYDPKESLLYDLAICPFFSDRANYQRNGRPDKEYE